MPVALWKHGLCYFPAPKVANTSIKHALHLVRTGEPFVNHPGPDGRMRHIHHAYGTPLFDKVEHPFFVDMLRFAVVRDPVDRIVSVWRNRVRFHLELSAARTDPEEMRRRDLPVDPDLATFVERLDDYIAVSPAIHHHAAPLVDFLGTRADYFHVIFEMGQIGAIEGFLSAVCGMKVSLEHLQSGGPKASRAELSDALVRRIEEFYARDYEAFGRQFEGATGGVRKVKPVRDGLLKIAGSGG